MLVDEKIDERTLREIYLPQFEAAVKQAHAGTVMCSYNKVNGTYACENDHLIQQILEQEWGFKGMRARRLRRRARRRRVAARRAGLRAVAGHRPTGPLQVAPRARRRARAPSRRSTSTCAATCARCSPSASSTAPPTPTTTRRSPRPRTRRPRRRSRSRRSRCWRTGDGRCRWARRLKTIAVIGAAADDVHDRRRVGQRQAVRVPRPARRRSGRAPEGATGRLRRRQRRRARRRASRRPPTSRSCSPPTTRARAPTAAA